MFTLSIYNFVWEKDFVEIDSLNFLNIIVLIYVKNSLLFHGVIINVIFLYLIKFVIVNARKTQAKLVFYFYLMIDVIHQITFNATTDSLVSPFSFIKADNIWNSPNKTDQFIIEISSLG